MATPISYVFFGTPRFAAKALDQFAAAGLMPELIVTAPDKPAGRGLVLTPPEVKEWAIAHNIPYIQPASLKEIPPELTAKKFDVFVVAAYGKILRSAVLNLPTKGCVNLHPSLLPRFRGAAPIESQILADEKPVGVSVMLMDEEMDHGPILAQLPLTIPNWPISRIILTELLAIQNGMLAAQTVIEYMESLVTPTPQNHDGATYTKKITKADGEITLDAPARENYLKYLAYDGWPGIYFFAQKNGKQIRVKITKASYENDSLIIERVIPEGKGEQSFTDFSKTTN